MRSREIRESFIDFFVSHGHRKIPSAPLVPHGDPTLLFTNAGMVQFKDFFLGLDTPPSPRAVSSQKCLRVSGKHNDLENVGPSPRHHTFFEMLGNFSFGDYFKAEAIEFAWQLVTDVWGLDSSRLFATVFEEDDEAEALWRQISGLPAGRIKRCGEKDNFWAMGDTGPCGPCSEIFIDLSPAMSEEDWESGCDRGRYVELWNLVFMQYERDSDGILTPLPKPSIDTGAGLERLSAVMQGVDSNYDSDLFQPILQAAAALAKTRYGASEESDVSLRVIADHLRAVGFLLADGVIPSNDGRGYVLRRLLRRAVRHGMGLGFEEPFLHRLLPVVRESMGEKFPELAASEAGSVATTMGEEEKFIATVATASRLVQEAIEATRREGVSVLSGEIVFRFYDTHGLPFELIREIAEEEQIELDEKGFRRALAEQRDRSRAAAGEAQSRMEALRDIVRGQEVRASEFVGYEESTVGDANVAWLAIEDSRGYRQVEKLGSGEQGVVVLDRTPFYAEAGGQVGDLGVMAWEGGSAEVSDTQKDASGTHFHFVALAQGELGLDTRVVATVDAESRSATERNHTSTHLLHAALRQTLGEGVRQAGSLVAPDRLRFDFTYHQPLTPDQLRTIEEQVNRWVMTAQSTVITGDRDVEEAIADGAMALFGEKYGNRVRTVEIPVLPGSVGEDPSRSLELCGGCHVRNTGEIGPFLIVGERGVAAGIRRIEALTGEGALGATRSRGEILETLADAVGTSADRLVAEVASLKERGRELDREVGRLRMKLLSKEGDENSVAEVGGVHVIASEVPPASNSELRNLADVQLSRLGSGVVVLASTDGDKVSLVAVVSKDLTGRIHAGNMLKRIAEVVGGTGGGRPDFAQAGGRNPEKLAAALDSVTLSVATELQGHSDDS